jgi:hypothetical protein
MQRHELEKLSREELIAHAERLNVPRPRVLTQPELIDEIIGRTTPSDRERARARGWLGKARDLLARVIEQGLHLPDAARAIRTSPSAARSWPTPPPPLPTVTLAEIYAAQGHLERAVAVLDEVIAREPDHKEARELRERFVEQTQRTRPRPSRTTDGGRAEASTETAAPKQEAAAPKQEEAAPKQEAAAPQQEAAAPKQEAAAPKQEEAAPKQEEATPRQEEAAPPMEAIAFAAESEPADNTNSAGAQEEARTSSVDEETKASSTEAEGETNAPEIAKENEEPAAADTADPAAATDTVAAEPAAEGASATDAAEQTKLVSAAEPAREELAAEDEGNGPVTERDTTPAPAAEAKPEEGAGEAESAIEAQDEIDQTIVDGEAIADLTDRLRALEAQADETPAMEASADEAQADEAQADEAQADEELPEDELPEGYDVDEVVAIAVDPETIYVYWEVRAVTLARALARRPSGRLALRIAAVTPSWDGPITRTWELHIDALFGDRFVRDIPQGANVRVSVGWLDGASFEPFAIGTEVASPRLVPSEAEASNVGHWTPEPPFAASPVPLNRAPRAYRTPEAWAGSPAPQAAAGEPATTAAPASPVPLSAGRPAPGLTALAPRGGSGPGIDRATRSAELTRSYFRSVAGSYIRGGASDLVRGGASDLVRGGASDLVRGGASDLVRGGASDLVRSRNV